MTCKEIKKYKSFAWRNGFLLFHAGEHKCWSFAVLQSSSHRHTLFISAAGYFPLTFIRLLYVSFFVQWNRIYFQQMRARTLRQLIIFPFEIQVCLLCFYGFESNSFCYDVLCYLTKLFAILIGMKSILMSRKRKAFTALYIYHFKIQSEFHILANWI